ncbi:MAG: GAF domain-containing protein, partial [Burkholderiales bacterium]|nr:GAF domain-containing protein [Anaerolineae bacterium]
SDTDELQQTSQKLPDDLPATGENVFMEIDRRSLMAAIRDSRALTINDPASDPIFVDAPEGVIGLVGRHIVELIQPGDDVVGALLVGRSLNDEPMDERDQQLAATLAAQIGIAYENRRLFRSAEGERQTLSSILETLPAGVLVLDARTFKPIQFNRQTENLLGQSLSLDRAFSAADYNLYRTGTNVYYPDEELPVFTAARSGGEIFSDDVAVIHENGVQTDLLVNAAPIHNAEGDVIAIVAAFQDISNLRGLENALQDNLRETIALYEATRSLSEAEEIEDVMSVIVMQLAGMNGFDAYVVLLDEQGGRKVVRAMVADIESVSLPDAMMDSARMLLVSSVERFAPLDAEARAQLQAQGIQSFVSAPLLARRNVAIGWAVVVYDEPHSFTPEEERFLTTLSDNAATTIDNRNLFVSTQSALQETASLYNATTAISRATTLDDLGQALQNALESMQPDWYAAYIVNGEGESGKLQTLFNLSADGGPSVDFEALAVRHSLIRDDNVYIDDLATLTAGGKPNGDSDPLMQALAGLGARSLASVSLRAKGTSSGRLLLAYNRPRRFTDGDARYLGALTDSASVIIDNILLFEQIQSNLEETSILYQASRALGDVTRPEEILEIVINYLMQPGVTQIFMGLLTSPTWDAPEAAIRVIASWQRDDSSAVDLQDVTLTAEQFPAWEQLTSTTVMGIDDVENDARITPAQRAGIASLDVSSLLVIPLRAANRAIGIIWIASHDTHVHSDRELRVYQAFAEQASITLEASRLLEQTGRRARQLQTSAQVSQFASSVLDLSILLPRLVDLIRDAFGYDHVQIFLMNDIDDFAHLTASTGEAGQQLLAIRHKLQKGSASVIGQVTANVVPVVALDTADARVVHRPNPYLPFTRSEMALPLIIKGEVVGALDVQSNLPNFFSEEDVNVLTTLAAQISVAIDNARLFERAERRASDMSFLFAVTTAAASAENLNDALQNAAELLRDSLSTMSVTVYLPEVYLDEHEDAHTLMRAVAMAGSDQPISEISEVRVGDESNLIGVTASSFEPMVIDNIELENRYLSVVSDARSAIIVPLSSGTDLIGLITMEDAALNAYDHEALTLLLTLSGTLSAIIQNAQLLQRVQQSNDQLRELDRLKSDFLANMSHELRTPLNSIIGFSRVILKGIDGPLTEMQEQDLTTIYNSGQHLLGLINDILDQAKIASGKMDLQQDHFEVKPLLDGVRSIGIGLVKDKPIDIRIETAAGLPRAYGDEFRTRQVLINLVSNA